MSRQKLSEYKAKQLLVSNYQGFSINLSTLDEDVEKLDEQTPYVVKVDQGIKKRGKQGLLRVNVKKQDAAQTVTELSQKGFSRFIAEPMLVHDDDEERYVSFEKTRGGIIIQYSKHGGIDIEDNPQSVESFTAETAPLPTTFVNHIITTMHQQHLSFIEINPLIIRDEECILLDAAVLVDSAGAYASDWTDDDIVDVHSRTESEEKISELNRNSPASFSFRLINPNGSLWLICFGGGASITVADEATNQHRANLMGNFGEYSGATVEESYIYAQALLDVMLQSNASRKALIIAGGVANFTDVKKTFAGTIQALSERKDQIVEQHVRVYVRRGGPNETEGLAMMEIFLKAKGLYGSVHGSDILLTDVINEALEYIDA